MGIGINIRGWEELKNVYLDIGRERRVLKKKGIFLKDSHLRRYHRRWEGVPLEKDILARWGAIYV